MRLPDFSALDVFNLDGTDSAACGYVIVPKHVVTNIARGGVSESASARLLPDTAAPSRRDSIPLRRDGTPDWCVCPAAPWRHLHGKFIQRDGSETDLYVEPHPEAAS